MSLNKMRHKKNNCQISSKLGRKNVYSHSYKLQYIYYINIMCIGTIVISFLVIYANFVARKEKKRMCITYM